MRMYIKYQPDILTTVADIKIERRSIFGKPGHLHVGILLSGGQNPALPGGDVGA
jgi:hypothetical protein